MDTKIAVVTGGSRGIGRAIAEKLAAAGCMVYINYVSRPDAAAEVKETIEVKGGKAVLVQCDVSQGEQVSALVKQVTTDTGSLDILVNNAGITRDGLMARMKETDWDAVLDTNLKGAFLCAKAASRAMMKKKWGRIINISSVSGYAGNAGQVNYAAAKAGMVGLTKAMAREFASRNITVNCVAPGYIVTEMTEAMPDEAKARIMAEIPMASLGSPDDIAAAVAFLASAEARYITGQTIHVNGGLYM